MSLYAEIESQSARKYQACTLSVIRLGLGDEDRAQLDEAVDDLRFTASAIAKVLTARGFTVSDSTVRRHRRGDCSCE